MSQSIRNLQNTTDLVAVRRVLPRATGVTPYPTGSHPQKTASFRKISRNDHVFALFKMYENWHCSRENTASGAHPASAKG
jgi:hypothetical protein